LLLRLIGPLARRDGKRGNVEGVLHSLSLSSAIETFMTLWIISRALLKRNLARESLFVKSLCQAVDLVVAWSLSFKAADKNSFIRQAILVNFSLQLPT
jgi:hypothetical protein